MIDGYRSEEELRNEIDRYVEAMGKRLPVDGCDLYVSASFGYAEFPTDADTADTLISHANAAMVEIKKAKSSEHVLRFTPELLRDEHVLEIENVIRMALEKDTFYFHLQPQYDVDHKLRGFEALARMKDDAGQNVSPGEFIPVIEAEGMISHLDNFMLSRVIDFIAQRLRKGENVVPCAINLSRVDFYDLTFIDGIFERIRDNDIDPSMIRFEVTESAYADLESKAMDYLKEMKDKGIKILLDDFGSGMSSLSMLETFDFDIIKLDLGFIRKIGVNVKAEAIIASTIGLAHLIGAKVTAEGVETEEQLQFLKESGCDYIQGYYFYKPMPEEEFISILD